MAVVTKTALKAKYQTGDFPTEQDFIDFIDTVYPYEKYVAIVSQTGTSAPVSIILENTLGVVPTWNYDGVGNYSINSSAFTPLKSTALMSTVNLAQTYHISLVSGQNNAFQITTSISSTPTNGMLNWITLEIRVYP